MAMYVYKDSARTEKLIARNAQKEDKSIRFYCLNPNCDAHMYIWNYDGDSGSYFQASKSHGHIEGCFFHASNEFKPNKFNEKEFQFVNLLSDLMKPSKEQTKKELPGEHSNGKASPNPPHTLSQIYSMCKSYDCNDSYNGNVIGQMLVDNRSIYMYPKGVFGWRLIEAKCKSPYFYDKVKKEITLISSTNGNEYEFILKFNDEKFFKEIESYIYPNREHLLVVSGEWKTSGKFNAFVTNFTSKRQLSVLR